MNDVAPASLYVPPFWRSIGLGSKTMHHVYLMVTYLSAEQKLAEVRKASPSR